MTEEKTTPTPTKRRRTAEEIRAWHEQEILRLAAHEKVELIRLLSGVHDDLQSTTTHPAGKPHAGAINAALTQIKAVLAALNK